jgi:hypothetical protein
MAKMRKTKSSGSLDPMAREMTAKQRQQAASRAAGLVASPSGLVHGNDKGKQYTLPSSVYRAAVQDKYQGSWQDAVRSYRKSPSETKSMKTGTPISAPLSAAAMASSKSAQAAFMASEKKKSSRAVANKTKRRGR